MERPNELGDNKATADYIEYLEGCLNGSSELILALNTASRVFAEDINIICEGGEIYDMDVIGAKSKMTLLSGDSKDKTFDRIMVLFDKFDKIKALSQHFTGSEQSKQSTKKINMKPGGNIYEHVINQVKNGHSKV